MKRFCLFTTLAVLAILARQAGVVADVWVEDFEHGFDSRFNHQITGSHFMRTFAYVSPEQALGLEPGTDVISFDLSPDEFIDYASVWFMNNCGGPCTTVEFVGTLGSQSFDSTIGYPEWEFVDTSGLSLGDIIEIRLIADQSIFDDVSINVVPDPGSLLLVFCGVCTLVCRKLHVKTH